MTGGVQVTGLVKPLDTATPPYPVFEDADGWGGYRTADDIAGRDGILASYRKEGMLVYVKKTKCIYALEADLATWTIIANVGLGLQATWFIDPVNGDDTNDGFTLATALKTELEFRSRCFPGSQQLKIAQNTTLTYVATTAQTLFHCYLNIGNALNSGTTFTFTVVFQISSTADMTLTNVITPVANTTRGEITVSSGAFVAKERIRVTSGAALGAIAYSTGLRGGVVTDTYVANFGSGVSTTARILWPAIGDKVQVDTLLWTVSRCEVSCGAFIKVVIQDAKITRGLTYGTNDSSPVTGGGGAVTFSGCQAAGSDSGWTTTNGAIMLNCRIPATAKIYFLGSEWLFVNQAVQGLMSVCGNSQQSYGIWLDGGQLIVGDDGDFNHPGDGGYAQLSMYEVSAGVDYGALQAENGPGGTIAAISIYNGVIRSDSFFAQMWGLSGGYAVGFRFFAGGFIYFYQNIDLTLYMAIASTTNIMMAGIAFAYSKNPINIPNQNCGIVLAQSDGLSLVTDNYLTKTGQTAAIATTPLITAPRNATYRFRGYLAPTVVGAPGNLTLNATYTDDSGVAQTKAVCSIDNTVLSGSGGSIEIESNGSGSISYSVTGYTAGLTYTLRLGAELDSRGP